MEEKCGWETGPNREQHETFLKAVLDMLLEKAVFEGTNRKNKLVEWQDPEELKQKMSLAVREEGMTHGELLALMQQVVKYSVKTGHPYFINQLYSGLDVYGLVGQWVTDALNPSVYTYEVAPVFTLMEIEVLSAMASLVGFEQHDGLFSPGGSISNMYGMLLARYRAFPEIKSKGCSELGRLVALTSIDAHYSLKKASMTLGIGSDNLVLVNTDAVGRMDVNHLKHCIEEEKKKKSTIIMVCATAGTTVLGAYDPVSAIADVCEKEGIWLHVDAAWGGGALISPALRHKIRGIHRADSVTWNPHKLLVAPQQCSVFLTRHPGLLKACNSASAAYLFQKHGQFHEGTNYAGVCGMRYHLLRALVVDQFLLPEPKPKRKRRAWVWPYLQKRLRYGHYDTLMDELYKENPDLYKNYTRMDRELFDSIVEAVTPIIERKTSRWRKPIDPSTRVAITLRYLATGDSYKSLQYAFRVAHNTICGIVPDTCNAIVPAFAHTLLRLPPHLKSGYRSQGFRTEMAPPHCIGSLDGKHIRIRVVERGERADWREHVACDGWRERRCCSLHTSSQFPPPLPPLAARKGAMVQR
ncbi:acidic amino acid decarboxylase GADL1-like [Portunus trituberculatus]|uniref:acidic amino acid decarboxylase GADL1-like n=1 Tax=Portunus trituberculatus TaxID=210409 RepID=UPI001E1D1414|nr:acidic amino acid decarboxylase GADL1-like [Portunus trituberculatus]